MSILGDPFYWKAAAPFFEAFYKEGNSFRKDFEIIIRLGNQQINAFLPPFSKVLWPF